MALIYQGKTTNTGKIRVAKNCGSLVLVTDADINFANATVSAYIERSGSNAEICTDVPFIDYLILNKIGETIRNFQTDHAVSGKRFRSIEWDFGSEAGLFIQGNDVLVFELKGIGTGSAKIYALDDLEYNTIYRKHEFKNMLADEKQRTFIVGGSEFVLIGSNVDKISNVVLRTQGGDRLEYSVDELRHIQATIMPYIGDKEVIVDGVPLGMPEYIDDVLLIPTLDIAEIEINRASSGLIPVHFQYDEKYLITSSGKPNMSKSVIDMGVPASLANRATRF